MTTGRRRWTAAERAAIGRRMKAYWKQRRSNEPKVARKAYAKIGTESTYGTAVEMPITKIATAHYDLASSRVTANGRARTFALALRTVLDDGPMIGMDGLVRRLCDAVLEGGEHA